MKTKILKFLSDYFFVMMVLLLFTIGTLIVTKTDYDLLGSIVCVIGILFYPIVSAVTWLFSKFKR
jgi:hypothetical protein